MKTFVASCLLMLSFILPYSGHLIHSVSYDYFAITKCLAEPWEPNYGGGKIVNPEFRHNIEGWTVFGNGAMKDGTSKEGNRFIVSYNRSQSLDSISQKISFNKGMLYSFSAWVQISNGSETVAVLFRTSDGKFTHGGYVIAEHGCWSFLKGGMVARFSGPVEILFKCKNPTVDIWVDNVSLQPFTMKQWRSQQDRIIEKVRKTKVRFQATYANNSALGDAVFSINQTKSSFPIGCGMNHYILTSTAYQNWFASRFKFTTFTNEMKWYSTEKKESQVNYTVADAMLRFAKKNSISIRGHNIFWDDPKHQPNWVKNLSRRALQRAATKRMNSVVPRYLGQVIAWDVMNENLHFKFYEDKLGENASSEFYLRAYQLDPKTTMFMNEYNTIEHSGDETANAGNYVKKLEEILSYPGNEGMKAGIGVQGHFGPGLPNLVYMRSSLDILGSTGLPIWLTEVDVGKGPSQAKYFKHIIREGYSHPAVKGIIIFAGPEIAGFNVTTLADKNFKSTPAGNVVDGLMAKWKSKNVEITTDCQGLAEISLFQGDYNLIIKHPVTNSSTTLSFKVKEDALQETIDVHTSYH